MYDFITSSMAVISSTLRHQATRLLVCRIYVVSPLHLITSDIHLLGEDDISGLPRVLMINPVNRDRRGYIFMTDASNQAVHIYDPKYQLFWSYLFD